MNSRDFLDSLDEPARKRLQPLYYLQGFITIAIMALVALGGLYDLPARLSYDHHIASDPDVMFFFSARTVILVVPFILGTLIVVGMLAKSVGGALAGPYKDDWIALQDGMNRGKFLTAVCGTIAVMAILALPLYVGNYVKVTNSGIITNDLFAFSEKQHAWTDISSLTCKERTASYRGHSHLRHIYTVQFSDGSSWELEDGGGYYSGDQSIVSCVDYIAQRAGKPVQYTDQGGN